MNKASRVFTLIMAFLILGNTPGLAMVCAPGCKASPQGLQLCLKACAAAQLETAKKYPGLPLIGSKALCAGLQEVQALPVVGVSRIELVPVQSSHGLLVPVIAPSISPLSLASVLSIHAPPRALNSRSEFLSTSPQNAPPVLG